MADLFSGPLALALLPITLILVYALGTSLGLILACVLLPSLVVFLARADVDDRVNVSFANDRKIEYSEHVFEDAIRAALYAARLRQNSVVCMMLELRRDDEDYAGSDRKLQYKQSHQDAVFIRNFLRHQDQVFVLGQHRFGLVLNVKDYLSEADALKFGMRMHADIMRAVHEEIGPQITAAFLGISVSTDETDPSATEMLDAAKTAVRIAFENAGSDVHVKALVGTTHDPRLRIIERDIESAVTGPGICGWFQPQICAQTGDVTGFETLARWKHPTEGMIPPSEFLPVLQRRGILRFLQDRMMREAFDGFQAWCALLDHPPSVALNLAPEDLLDPKLPERILWELDRRKMDPRFLTIEILEMVIAKSRDDTQSQNIRRLAEMGCQIDLDDFGTGHASISTLQQLTVHRLKIDRSFISGLEDDQEKQNMVSAILTMADQLGLDTLAEGVETPGERACLTDLGCRHLQGFGIAKPMPLHDALEWLQHRSDAKQADPKPLRLRNSKTG